MAADISAALKHWDNITFWARCKQLIIPKGRFVLCSIAGCQDNFIYIQFSYTEQHSGLQIRVWIDFCSSWVFLIHRLALHFKCVIVRGSSWLFRYYSDDSVIYAPSMRRSRETKLSCNLVFFGSLNWTEKFSFFLSKLGKNVVQSWHAWHIDVCVQVKFSNCFHNIPRYLTCWLGIFGIFDFKLWRINMLTY